MADGQGMRLLLHIALGVLAGSDAQRVDAPASHDRAIAATNEGNTSHL
jgi:hypothetical protein